MSRKRLNFLLIVLGLALFLLAFQLVDVGQFTQTSLSEESGEYDVNKLLQLEPNRYPISLENELVFIESKIPPMELYRGDETRYIIPYPDNIKSKLCRDLYDITEIVKNSDRYIQEDGSIPVIIRTEPQSGDLLGIVDGILNDIPNSYVKTEIDIISSVSANVDLSRLDEVVSDPSIERICLDKVMKFNLNETIPLINADDVWEQEIGGGLFEDGDPIRGQGINIAILDTGIDYTHLDLDGNKVTRQSDFVPSSAPDCNNDRIGDGDGDDDNDAMDDNGHGTHVASIAAGKGFNSTRNYTGVAPNSSLWASKVLGPSGCGFTSWVISGLEWATDPNGDGDFSDRANIISMSLGSDCEECDGNDDLSLAVDNATERGSLVVVSAGNRGPETETVGNPGVSKGAITVGASDIDDQIAEFSSRGYTGDYRTKPDIVAPGVAVCAAQFENFGSGDLCDDGYTALSGTSMSTPHVAGAAALLKQVNNEWGPAELKNILMSSSVDIGYLPTIQGSGRLDALRAYESIIAVNDSSLSFGNIGTDSNDSKLVEITNIGENNQDINIIIENATRREDGNEYSVLSTDIEGFSLLPGESQTVQFSLNLEGLDDFFEGYVKINTSADIYRIPYSGGRFAKIEFSLTEDGNLVNSYAQLFDQDFNLIEERLDAGIHEFNVESGSYYIISHSDFGQDSFMVKTEMIDVPIGGNITKEISLNDVPNYTFRAFDKNGFEIKSKTDKNVLHITDSNNNLIHTLGKTDNGVYDNLRNPVKLYNLNVSDRNFKIYYEKTSPGVDVPECDKPLDDRTSEDKDKCKFSFLSSDEFYYGGWLIESVSSQDKTDFKWNATKDSNGPYSTYFGNSFDNIQYDGSNLHFHDMHPFFKRPSSVGGDKMFIGNEKDVYYSNNNDWRLFSYTMNELVPLSCSGDKCTYRFIGKSDYSGDIGATELFNIYDSNPSYRHLSYLAQASNYSFYPNRFELGGIYTNSSSLEIQDYTLKNGPVYLFDYKPGGTRSEYRYPSISIYENGTLDYENEKHSWINPTDGERGHDLGYIIGNESYEIVLKVPDIGHGNIIERFYFDNSTGDRTVPYIDFIDRPYGFSAGDDYEMKMSYSNKSGNVSFVSFEYLDRNGTEIFLQDGFEDNNTDPFNLSGDVNWSTTGDESSSGNYSAIVSGLDTGESGNMSINVNITSSMGLVEFSKRIRGTGDQDFLRFYIDGEEIDSWSGDHVWDTERYYLDEGVHELTWRYSKNSGVGSSEAWIDDILVDSSKWENGNITREGTNITASFVPYSEEPVSVKIFLENDDGNYAEYIIDPIALNKVGLNTTISYNEEDEQVFGDCMTDNGNKCPDISVDVFCGNSSRSWYFQNGSLGKLNMSCQEDPIVSFSGSGSFSAFNNDNLSGFVIIDNDNEFTNNNSVSLDLSCDSDTDVQDVRYSNEDKNWTEWMSFNSSINWTLSPEEGDRIVYYQCRSISGKVEEFNDNIILDTSNPGNVSISIDNDVGQVSDRNVTLQLECQDDISGVMDVRYSNEDKNWTSWQDFSETKDWTLSNGTGEKTVYYRCRDNAGNIREISDNVEFQDEGDDVDTKDDESGSSGGSGGGGAGGSSGGGSSGGTSSEETGSGEESTGEDVNATENNDTSTEGDQTQEEETDETINNQTQIEEDEDIDTGVLVLVFILSFILLTVVIIVGYSYFHHETKEIGNNTNLF